MTTSRRSFFKCLVGAFVASAIELRMQATSEVSLDELRYTAVLSNEVLDRIYAQLIKGAAHIEIT